jgi:hypothetical protein
MRKHEDAGISTSVPEEALLEAKAAAEELAFGFNQPKIARQRSIKSIIGSDLRIFSPDWNEPNYPTAAGRRASLRLEQPAHEFEKPISQRSDPHDRNDGYQC